MTRRYGGRGRAARRVWLAVVVAIVAAGVATVMVPRSPSAPPSPRTSASVAAQVPTEPTVFYSCLRGTGAFGFGNLRAGAQDYRGEVLGDVEIVAAPGSVPAGRPDATPLDRDRILSVFDACLLRTPFASPGSTAGRAALLRLFEYHVTTYWPCLRAHGADPGPSPTLAQYLNTSGVPRLLPFQSDFAGSPDDVRLLVRACPFDPGAAS